MGNPKIKLLSAKDLTKLHEEFKAKYQPGMGMLLEASEQIPKHWPLKMRMYLMRKLKNYNLTIGLVDGHLHINEVDKSISGERILTEEEQNEIANTGTLNKINNREYPNRPTVPIRRRTIQ